ncbi:MAG: Do family serine endopeptidase [Acidobacteriota bacterium]|nr:Do family serine endopeptidase [Acidobacteriota bacterium]
MSRRQFLGMTFMIAAAVLAGVFVATLVPARSVAEAQELKLAPPAPPSAAVVVPSFADLVERAVPSVVHVTSRRLEEQEFSMLDHPLFRRFRVPPFGEDDAQREPQMQLQQQSGSGFFFTSDGYIMTNKHVVDGAERLIVRTHDDREFDAQFVGNDPFLDVAVIKLETDETFPPLPLGDSESLRVGEWVVAIGNPVYFRNTVTVGVLSGKGRQLESDSYSLGSYLQTDAPINFGNSGGPLLNVRGEVVGINTAILRDNPQNPQQDGLIEGIGFALPVTPVKRVIDQIVDTGTVKRGFLGVSVAALTADSAAYYGLDRPRGALIANVTPGLPAAKAGLRTDDIVMAVDGTKIENSQQLVEAISSKSPGDTVSLTIWRDRGELDVTVKLDERRSAREQRDERPRQNEPEPDTASALGFTVENLTDRVRESLGDTDLEGVLISDVEPGSTAADAGVRPSQVLFDINGTPIKDLKTYRKVVDGLERGQIVRLRVGGPGGDQGLLFFRVP